MNVHKCENIRRLQSPKYICNYIDLSVNTHLVKQQTDEWLQLHKKCFITASTMFNALGFHGRKELNNHFQEHVHKKGSCVFGLSTQIKLDHGIENEVSNK